MYIVAKALNNMSRTVDCGDYVVVSNARNIKVTGKKAEQLVYRHHTMFPGGLKEIKYKDMMAKKPDEVSVIVDSRLTDVPILEPRSSDKRSPACCPKTSCVSADSNGCGYSRARTLARSSTIS